MKGIILFVIAFVLGLVFLPIGLAYSIVVTFCKTFLKRFATYLFVIAIAIDQLGNVVMQDLFNDIIIKRPGHKFGNEDETISSVLGKNRLSNTLTKTGKILDGILNLLEKNHSVKSIEKDETETN